MGLADHLKFDIVCCVTHQQYVEVMCLLFLQQMACKMSQKRRQMVQRSVQWMKKLACLSPRGARQKHDKRAKLRKPAPSLLTSCRARSHLFAGYQQRKLTRCTACVTDLALCAVRLAARQQSRLLAKCWVLLPYQVHSTFSMGSERELVKQRKRSHIVSVFHDLQILMQGLRVA